MSDYLRNARDFSIGDHGNLSTVHGNQQNNYQITTGDSEVSQRKHSIFGTQEEEAQYAEYHDVQLGDIVIKRDLGTSGEVRRWFFDKEKQEWVSLEYEHKLFTAEVRSKVGKVSSTYTVVSYHGPEKEEGWKKDFDQFSGALSSTNVQVFGYNRSKAPLLLLHNDLVPLAHFLDSVGGLGHMYLELLRLQLGCRDCELWLDSSRGILCHGPQGPCCRIPPNYTSYYNESAFPNVLSDGKMLQEDVLVQYLATLQLSRGLDRVFVEGLCDMSVNNAETINSRVDRPTVISSLTNNTIAVADAGMSSIQAWDSSCLGEREVLSNGLTRFTLEHRGHHLELDWDWDWDWMEAWIAQSPMVFHAHGISMEANLSEYDLIVPYTYNGTLSQSRTKRRRRQKCAPIYLFVTCYFSTTTYWSFEEDGHLPIPDDFCEHLGLPKLSLKCQQYTFSTQTYKAMRDYQTLRGFDPTTADFARHCGFDKFEFRPVQPSLAVATTSSRFEDLDNLASVGAKSEDVTTEDLESVYKSLSALFSDVSVEDDMSTDAPEPVESSGVMTSVWSRLTPSFSWTASEDSDIPAAGF